MPSGVYKHHSHQGFQKGNPTEFKKGHSRTGNRTGENNPNWKDGRSKDKVYKRQYSKEYYQKNKERVLKRVKQYRQAHKAQRNRYQRKYFKNHPEYLKRGKRKRRARLFNAKGSHTQAEWELLKKRYNYCCPSCGKCEPEIELTEDHICPLSRGGSDYIVNIQPLCRSCNSKKCRKIIKY